MISGPGPFTCCRHVAHHVDYSPHHQQPSILVDRHVSLLANGTRIAIASCVGHSSMKGVWQGVWIIRHFEFEHLRQICTTMGNAAPYGEASREQPCYSVCLPGVQLRLVGSLTTPRLGLYRPRGGCLEKARAWGARSSPKNCLRLR